MTDKDLAHRYADVPSLVADLEDALAIEAARQGTSTGEATAVIRTLPARARRRLPFRMRHSLPLLGVIALVARRRRDRDRRSSPGGRRARRARAPAPAASSADARGHQDRLGPARPPRTPTTRSATSEEHSDEASRVVDRDDGTAWSHRELPRRPRGRGQARRRPLHRRQAQGRGRPAADRDARAGLEGDDLRRPARLGAQVRPRRLDQGRRRHRQREGQALQARHRRHGVPLLPRLDHEARRRTPTAPRSPRSACSRKSRTAALRRRRSVSARSARTARASRRSQRSGNGTPGRPPRASGRRSSS